MKRLIKSTLVVVMFTLMLTGCVPKNKNVVVTSYPLEYLVTTLAGDRVNVERLDVGSTPQTAQIRDDYKEVLEKADTMFYINEIQPYWEIYRDDIISNNKIEVIDMAERSSLYNFARFTKVTAANSTHVVESPYYDTPNFERVDVYDKDPFIWMDPLAMTSMARTIKDWLVATYPDDAAKFEERFSKLEIELTSLQADFQQIKTPAVPIKIVTMTPTFGNWQKSFGVEVYPVTISKFGALPTEAMLNDIRTSIQTNNVKHIAFEEGMTEEQTALYNQLKTELSLTEIQLSNVYSLSEKDVAEQYDYIRIMYQNLETLKSISR
ncbi:metal ABC transporter substrate-binding protein [Erysipelothrix aquatica]|uniref:metal ABC transporter substrate-binding protein n=1 Tax=Erysipelothrix aquatica TaxID=2683714 RepID=UPI001358C11E|nr:metal ABC transporter substrate-binding protein [Erysipelothrix aquatica]